MPFPVIPDRDGYVEDASYRESLLYKRQILASRIRQSTNGSARMTERSQSNNNEVLLSYNHYMKVIAVNISKLILRK